MRAPHGASARRSKNRTGPVMAHSDALRQRSTSVAFGAKRILTKPRCRAPRATASGMREAGGAAAVSRRYPGWARARKPQPAAGRMAGGLGQGFAHRVMAHIHAHPVRCSQQWRHNAGLSGSPQARFGVGPLGCLATPEATIGLGIVAASVGRTPELGRPREGRSGHGGDTICGLPGERENVAGGRTPKKFLCWLRPPRQHSGMSAGSIV
jgi:hypothetical protein